MPTRRQRPLRSQRLISTKQQAPPRRRLKATPIYHNVREFEIAKYVSLCTDLDPASVAAMPPNEAKRAMARAMVALYHREEAAKAAEERFDLVHRRHEVPDDVPVVALPAELAGSDRVWVPRLLVALGLASSNSEGRRLIEQGGVKIDGEPATEIDVQRSTLAGALVQAGKRRFMRFSGA